jgi:hypothetical protein
MDHSEGTQQVGNSIGNKRSDSVRIEKAIRDFFYWRQFIAKLTKYVKDGD